MQYKTPRDRYVELFDQYTVSSLCEKWGTSRTYLYQIRSNDKHKLTSAKWLKRLGLKQPVYELAKK